MSALLALFLASSSAHAADAPKPALPLVLKWTVDIAAPPVAGAAPVSDDTHVYIALRTGQVIARANADGAPVWQRDLATEHPLAVDAGFVFVAGADALHALRAADGAIGWQAPVPIVTAPLLAHGGWVIVVSAGKVLAFNSSDGTLVWQRAIGAVTVRPAIDGDRLYVSETDGTLLALEVRSGNVLWEQRLRGPLAEPFGWYGFVYVGGGDHQMYCLQAKDGEVAWRWRVGPFSSTSASGDDARVYFIGTDNVLRALDRGTGVQQWQAGLKRRPSAGAVVMDKWVAVPSSSSAEIWIWTAEGRTAATIATPTEIPVAPDFVESTTDGAKIYVITGSLARVWQLTLVATADDPPAVALEELPGTLAMLPGTPVTVEVPRS